jgi:hypothetical protein
VKRPAFWVLLGGVSLSAALLGYRYFPKAFSIVALEITMDRERALSDARGLMARDGLGPEGYRQAASFALDNDAQTFVELEGGGKEAFTRMLRDGLYSAYTWRVRHFKEGETNETLVRFTPSGQPTGSDGWGRCAGRRARRGVGALNRRRRRDETMRSIRRRSRWSSRAGRRPAGRVDHTFTPSDAPTLNDGRYPDSSSGDRLTEVAHFVKVPEAFSRRYENMRPRTKRSASARSSDDAYVVGGIGVGCSSCCGAAGSCGGRRWSGEASSGCSRRSSS